MKGASMDANWHITISPQDMPLLHQKMLGLTFFERRLREAKKAGISTVSITAPENIRFPTIHSIFCAPYSVVKEKPETAIQVPLYALLSVEKSPSVLMEIKSREDFSAAKKFCRQQIIQGSGAGWVAKNINKAFSLPISSLLSYTFITPNMWTVFNMLIGVSSAFFISSPGYWNGVLGGLLLQLASIFDGVDGEIAKFRYETSPWGAVLDSIADNGTLVAFLGGLVFFYTQNSPSQSMLFLTTTIGLAVLLIVYVWQFVHRYFQSDSLVTFDGKFLQHLPAQDFFVRLAKSLKDYIKKDFYSAVFFLCCLVGRREWVLYLMFAGALTSLIIIIRLTMKYSPSKTRVQS